MNFKLLLIILISFTLNQLSAGQQETYTVIKAPFSSKKYDEFCPVYYKNGIIFTTNRKSGSFVDYSSSRGTNAVEIFFVDTTGKVTWHKARLFSKSLKTPFNDGPVTFNNRGDTVYYSRNLQVNGKASKLSTARNRLGIFSAVLEGNKWTRIRELRFNNEWYNISTPWLSPDGKRLYFASDKPGGYGGSDLYYCEWKGDYWADPVNLGSVINTTGNEAYPFINPAGELFFASDGHPGLGGKDIFFSRLKDDNWLPPVPLDPPVNSQYDEFGLITDSLMNEGYFSSDRDKSIDIYEYKTSIPQIFYSDIQKENQYCFSFNDTGAIDVDTMYLRYIWDFGDGKKASGEVANHCFPGPGTYNVKLDIIDRATGNIFFTKLKYTVVLSDYEQPYINSPDAVITGEQAGLDGLKSYLPGCKILSYSWDFGDTNRMTGETVKYVFNKTGENIVKLALSVRNESTHAVHQVSAFKKIMVFNTDKGKNAFLADRTKTIKTYPDIREYENVAITTEYSAEEEFQQGALFNIELLSSKNKVAINSTVFRNIPSKFLIEEIFTPVSGTYSYMVFQQMTLMAEYPAFREITGSGFRNARIMLKIIDDPVEKELYNLMKNYGILTDNYFDSFNRLKANGYLMLDQIVILMNRNPGIRLEIGIHTDNLGTLANNLTISQVRARVMVSYLINRGIDAKRLVAKGYGGMLPVASNILEKDRRLNRRIDFRLID